MKTYNSIILLALLLVSICSFSLTAQPLQTENLTVSEGLSNPEVRNIMQDTYGLIWIATQDGLNIYDGYTFKIFKNVPGNPNSIISNEIHAFAEDKDKNVWVASEGGVSKYIRAKDQFVNYDFEEIFPDKKDNFDRTLNLVIDKKKDVWVATVGLGVVKYDSSEDDWQLQTYASEDSAKVNDNGLVLGLSLDLDDRLWAGIGRRGLMWYDEEIGKLKPAEFKNKDKTPDFAKPGSFITYLYTDAAGVLWITTRSGIYKYDTSTKIIKTIQEYNTHQLNFWTYFNWISHDAMGNVWISNNLRGVLKFDGISDDFQKITFAGQSFFKDGISDIRFTRFIFDRTGILWLSTITRGVLKHDPHRAPFLHYQHDAKNKFSISGNQVFGLFESQTQKGKVFVGVRSGGLNLFDPVRQEFSKIPLQFFNDDFGGSVRSIFEEKNGTLWLGTWGDGLLKMTHGLKVERRFTFDSSKTNSLSGNLVRLIKQTANGDFWIGTNSGLNYLDRDNNTIKRITDRQSALYPQGLLDIANKKLRSDKASIKINNVTDYQDLSNEFKITKPRNYLIISTGEGRIGDSLMADYGWIENSHGEKVWSAINPNEGYAFGGNEKNRIKIGLHQFTPGTYKLRYKSDDSHSYGKWNADPPTFLDFWGTQIIEINDNADYVLIKNYLEETKNRTYIEGNNIRSLHLSNNNVMWIGTDKKGLNRYNLEKQTVKNYSFDIEKPSGLSNNSIQYIHEDEEGILWLATNGGLNRFDPVKEIFTVFTEDDGLPTNYIASILPGTEGELWISSRNGISKMVTSHSTGKITFVNYDPSDGLGGSDFIAQVALKSSAGQYYFGGEHGLNSFTPGIVNNTPPELILSDLKISNTSVFSQKSEYDLDTSLTDFNRLELPYNQNDLSFSFSALHFSNPQKNQYAHRLEGYDEEWIYDNNRIATYTNLDPGEYSFLFKGSNRDGLWNDKGKSIQVIIHPPWWFTAWAYIGYGLVFVGIIFGIDRFQRRRLLSKAKEKMKIQDAEHRAEAAELQAKATEAQSKVIQAENERKTKELEEARELQLSMLPKELPQIPNLDIAVYMKTATEVGGDYYDFHIGMDGTLTVVVGDATGHGMKAGTMVTTTKSLFNVLAPNPNIVETFHEMTRCLKLMQMNKLSMCMTMLKIMGNKIQMSAAGMPPVFIYKRESQTIEEHVIKGMPLGTFNEFPYSLVESTISSGDTILMMSDGFPELFNDKKEMFGYKRTRNLFEDLAEQSPEDIISRLKEEGSKWVKDKDPDDDVTFVVIKVK